MSRKKKYLLFLLLTICIGIVVLYFGENEHPNNWSFKKFVDRSYVSNLDATELSEDIPLYYEGESVAFDSGTNTVYIPQNIFNNKWEGKLSSDFKIAVPYDEYWDDKILAISESHPFTIWLINGNSYYEMALIITGTPIISISTIDVDDVGDTIESDEIESDEPQYYFVLWDPGNVQRPFNVEATICEFYIRGASSKSWAKKPYRINLLSEPLNKKSYKSLLGMDASAKWNLSPLFSDGCKVREKTSAEIWNMMNQKSGETKTTGIQEEYVELIYDHQYLGLYCLMRPVNYVTQNLSNNDILYKTTSWTVPDEDQIDEAIENDEDSAESVELKYPSFDPDEMPDDYYESWDAIRTFLDVFYGDNEYDYEVYSSLVDEDNILNYFLYINIVTATDNNYKNMYYLADYSPKGKTYKIYVIPWDLDATFGDRWYYPSFDENFQKILRYVPASKLYSCDPDGISKKISNLWNGYQSTLSGEKIGELLISNFNYLTNTGAYIREQERWPDNIDLNFDELLEYNLNHMEYLDQLISENTLLE